MDTRDRDQYALRSDTCRQARQSLLCCFAGPACPRGRTRTSATASHTRNNSRTRSVGAETSIEDCSGIKAQSGPIVHERLRLKINPRARREGVIDTRQALHERHPTEVVALTWRTHRRRRYMSPQRLVRERWR